jgi:hypothetical protein
MDGEVTVAPKHDDGCMLSIDIGFEEAADFKPVCTCTVENASLLSVPDGIKLWESKTGKDWPAGAELMSKIVHALMVNVKGDMTRETAHTHANEFLVFMGKLLTIMEHETPTPAKAAAILVVAERLKLQLAGDFELSVIVTLIEAAQRLSMLVKKNSVSDA